MHCITLPKVPSPRVLTISSATQNMRDGERQREEGEKRGGRKGGDGERAQRN